MPRKSRKRSGANEARSLRALPPEDPPRTQEDRTPQERAPAARWYAPDTDIYETGEALVIVMDVPGVSKGRVDIKLESRVLVVEGRIQLENYRGLEPVHTEYNVGHFSRRFTVPERVDADGISAHIADGVLTVSLPKAPEARRRRIPVR